jgi:hypothetical protein
MTFDEILSQVQDLLQREQRVSYRGLKRRFALDDEYIEDLKEERSSRAQARTVLGREFPLSTLSMCGGGS